MKINSQWKKTFRVTLIFAALAFLFQPTLAGAQERLLKRPPVTGETTEEEGVGKEPGTPYHLKALHVRGVTRPPHYKGVTSPPFLKERVTWPPHTKTRRGLQVPSYTPRAEPGPATTKASPSLHSTWRESPGLPTPKTRRGLQMLCYTPKAEPGPATQKTSPSHPTM